MSAHEITHLLHQDGLGVVFAVVGLQALGLPLPGTTVLIAAALYAGTSHGLPIVAVIAAGVLGAVAGTLAGFAIGRWKGEGLLLWGARRVRWSPERVQEVRAEFAAHGTVVLFGSRFITGLRNVIGVLTGASGMSFRTFLPVTAAAALVWATVNALEYYWFGRALEGAATWLQVVLIAVGIGWAVLSFKVLRGRVLRRLHDGSAVVRVDEPTG